MPRISPHAPEQATGKTKELYDGLQQRLGKVLNIFQLMGNSAAVLDGYLQFSGALRGGGLDPKLREAISLATSEINGCLY